jgi:hypothetical protein
VDGSLTQTRDSAPPAVPQQAVTPPATIVQTLPTAPVAPPVSEPAPRPIVTDPVLRVSSDPAGARVTVDGVGWGATPLVIRHLPPGAKRIRLTKDGYVADERVVSLSNTGPTSVQMRLRRRPG